MEALERENNAKEALGVNITAGEAAECEGAKGGDGGVSTSAGDCGEEAKEASCRVVALQRSVESKVRFGISCGQARVQLRVLSCAPAVLWVEGGTASTLSLLV